jgi:hypothetical protein
MWFLQAAVAVLVKVPQAGSRVALWIVGAEGKRFDF